MADEENKPSTGKDDEAQLPTAVISAGGRQHLVSVGSTFEINAISTPVGESVEFDQVLLRSDANGVSVGRPVIEGAIIKAKVVSQFKGPKKLIFKKIRRHGKRLTKGHRQPLTRLQVTELS